MFTVEEEVAPPLHTLPPAGMSGEEVVAAASKVLAMGESGCCHLIYLVLLLSFR